jgi:hypothetical protein
MPHACRQKPKSKGTPRHVRGRRMGMRKRNKKLKKQEEEEEE